jgi:hypothetical protein
MDNVINPEPRIFSIPEENLHSFDIKFARIVRRAAKLGCGEITLTKAGTEDWPAYLKNFGVDGNTYYLAPGQVLPLEGMLAGFARRYHLFTVSGSAPILNGWKFIGAIERVCDEEGKVLGNILRTVPGEEVPAEFRDASPWCHHCNIQRHWASTFIVLHEDGTHKQVGRRCLKDFTGHASPEQLASYAELLMEADSLLEDDEFDEFGGGRGGERYYDVENLMQHTSALVRKDGWKSKAKYEVGSTAEYIRHYLCSKGNDVEEFEKAYPVEDIDRTVAAAAIDWMQSLAEKENASEYEHNLSMVGRMGAIPMKSLGLLCSGIAAYNRAHEKAEALKHEAVTSQHVGEPKKRMEMNLTVISSFAKESIYGVSTKLKFRDESGNIIIWWASGDKTMPSGTVIRAKATVHEHKEYNGVKETYVKRLAVLESLDQKPAESVAA